MKYDGGPAFPIQFVDHGNGPESPIPFGMGGASLRDYFAGKALIGVMQATMTDKRLDACEAEAKEREMTLNELWALVAYETADAMLAERSKP